MGVGVGGGANTGVVTGVTAGLGVGSGVNVAVAVGTGVTTGVAGVCVRVVVGVMVGVASIAQPIALVINAIINNSARKIKNLFIASQIIACRGRGINASHLHWQHEALQGHGYYWALSRCLLCRASRMSCKSSGFARAVLRERSNEGGVFCDISRVPFAVTRSEPTDSFSS